MYVYVDVWVKGGSYVNTYHTAMPDILLTHTLTLTYIPIPDTGNIRLYIITYARFTGKYSCC